MLPVVWLDGNKEGAMTDGEIEALIAERKDITNPSARWIIQRGSRQKTFQLELAEGMPSMELKLRQSIKDPDSFSCVLLCHLGGGEKITLRRYNGSNHVHGNALDRHMPDITFTCHVHMARQRYIEAGLKADGFAVPATYSDFDGALLQVMQDCNIHGFTQRNAGPTSDLYDD